MALVLSTGVTAFSQPAQFTRNYVLVLNNTTNSVELTDGDGFFDIYIPAGTSQRVDLPAIAFQYAYTGYDYFFLNVYDIGMNQIAAFNPGQDWPYTSQSMTVLFSTNVNNEGVVGPGYVEIDGQLDNFDAPEHSELMLNGNEQSVVTGSFLQGFWDGGLISVLVVTFKAVRKMVWAFTGLGGWGE